MDVNDQQLRLRTILCLILAVGFAVRVAALVHYGTGAIESEGAEYARIAENLRNGVGYVGLATPGPEVNFPPLFPLLIAGASNVIHDYEWAGRVVSLVLTGLLPLPVFGIASRLFDGRVGLMAALLASLHPLLVHLSFAVFSEGPYATLLFSAIYLTITALTSPLTKAWVLVGGAFGFSYLLRTEACGAFAIAVLFALTVTQGGAVVKCKRAVAAILMFLVIASPEIIFIYKSTGKVRLEVKSAIFFYTARRILVAETTPGMSYRSPAGGYEVASPEPNVDSWERWEEKWAWDAIDSHCRGTGTAMHPFAQSVQAAQVTNRELFSLAKGVGRNAAILIRQFRSAWLGAPLLPALAMLGALGRPWRRPQASSRLFVMLIAAVPFIANPFALTPDDPRYSFIFVPLFCIWAANGLFEATLWTRASIAAAGWNALANCKTSQYIIPVLMGLAIIVGPINGVRGLGVFEESAIRTRVDKEVGLWIRRQQDHPVRIMALRLPLAYHAGAQFVHFPYCTGELALQYLDAGQVDYVVLSRGLTFTKYYQEWMTQGIPDFRAELLHISPHADAKFVVYRWHREVK